MGVAGRNSLAVDGNSQLSRDVAELKLLLPDCLRYYFGCLPLSGIWNQFTIDRCLTCAVICRF